MSGKKVATNGEPKGILTAWHGPGNISPVSHMAHCHIDLSIPNFGVRGVLGDSDIRERVYRCGGQGGAGDRGE
jgi:mannonate dehydratase